MPEILRLISSVQQEANLQIHQKGFRTGNLTFPDLKGEPKQGNCTIWAIRRTYPSAHVWKLPHGEMCKAFPGKYDILLLNRACAQFRVCYFSVDPLATKPNPRVWGRAKLISKFNNNNLTYSATEELKLMN